MVLKGMTLRGIEARTSPEIRPENRPGPRRRWPRWFSEMKMGEVSEKCGAKK